MATFKRLISMNIKACMQYKVHFLFHAFVQAFVILVNYALFRSIYIFNGAADIKGYSLMQIVWYYEAINFVYIFVWNMIHYNMSQKVISGDLVTDLMHPVSLFTLGLTDAIGERLVGILLEFVPSIILLSILVFPTFMTFLSLMRFLIIVIIGFFLYYSFSFTISLIVFAVKNSTTVVALKEVVAAALGGVYIPLEYLSASFSRFLDFLPFKYMFYWPAQFFLNRDLTQNWSFFFEILGIQILWTIFFLLIGKALYRIAIKKFCAAGG